MKDREIDVLARTIWGEARNQGREGMEAVACVIRNRVALGVAYDYWWGNTIEKVCQKPYQFSCWLKDDPNLPKLLAVTPANDIAFRVALEIAANYDSLFDHTNGATHYHTRNILPKWSNNEKPTAIIGAHIFYRLREVPRLPAVTPVQSVQVKQKPKGLIAKIIGKK
jgi:spore germination cell wall hydrolase CwlJ-like protein